MRCWTPRTSIGLSKASAPGSTRRSWDGRAWRRVGTSGCCWSATLKGSTRNAGLPGARPTRWRSAVFCGCRWPSRPRIIRRFLGRGAPSTSRPTAPSSRGCSNGWWRRDCSRGKTVAVDATTLEANAAMRSIVRRDTGESYQEFLTGLAKASGVETPTREDLARLDRKRKKKTSNQDWKHPWDPEAKVAKMKDGRTHLAHKAEHAVDLETGAMVAVTLQGADQGDTTTIVETAIAAADQIEDAQAQLQKEIIADKGYHSNQTMIDLEAVGVRS